jgi:hypothetical protein
MTTDEHQPGAVIHQLCLDRLVPLGITGMGVSIMTSSGNRGRAGASGELSAWVEELQFSLGEGPCFDAFTDDRPVLVADLVDDDSLETRRWPVFARAAEHAGVRAIFALPMRVGSQMMGAIDLIRDSPGGLSEPQLALARDTAASAAQALVSQLVDEDAVEFRDSEVDGSSYRFQVHQAVGMVRVQLGVSAADALARLRARAFAEERAISDMAGDVVTRRVVFSKEDK